MYESGVLGNQKSDSHIHMCKVCERLYWHESYTCKHFFKWGKCGNEKQDRNSREIEQGIVMGSLE